MKAMFQTSSVLPPYNWKGSADPEKDYIHENMKHVRQTSSQSKLAKSKPVPMKVKFIPGVTKNPKFEHVGSRVAGLIRGLPNRASDDIEIHNSNSRGSIQSQMNGTAKKSEADLKPIWGASLAANARRSHSTSATDLRKSESNGSLRRKEVPPYLRRNKPLLPHEESVYNWRFLDINSLPSNFADNQRNRHSEKLSKFKNAKDVQFHRVEYLPCDGICAEETVEVECHNGDSGRSSSSSRTSRGINTEETRIYPEESLRQAQSFDRFDDTVDNSEIPHTPPSMFTKTRNLQTQTGSNHSQSHNQLRNREVGQGDGDFTNGFSNLRINGGGSHGLNTASTSTSTLNQVGPGGDHLPHKAGVVPKYLKDRQLQWKVEEEAKQKAVVDKDIPEGHSLMPEAERVKTMNDLKSSYDKLVNDLNRIPIHIDTIRIRNHKIELEQQLTKLEQAMRIFARPRVYVKNNS